jgi:hypothetical protein
MSEWFVQRYKYAIDSPGHVAKGVSGWLDAGGEVSVRG